MLFGFIFLDSDEDPLPPKIRYMHAISISLCTLLYLCIYIYICTVYFDTFVSLNNLCAVII